MQLLGQVEGALVETTHRAIRRACSLGEKRHRIALLDTLTQALGKLFVAIGCMVAVGIAHDAPEEGRVPHPAVGHQHQPRCRREQEQDINKGLVVGDQYGRTLKLLPRRILAEGLHHRHHPQEKAREAIERAVENRLAASPLQRQQLQNEDQSLQIEASDKEAEESQYALQQAPNRIGRTCTHGLRRNEQTEEERLKRVGHQQHHDHTQHRDQGDGLQGRMAGKDQHTHTHHGRKGREEDGRLMRTEQFAPRAVLLQEAVHDKDREVVTDTEDKGGQDHIHDVETDVEERHQTQDNHPGDAHRQESHHRQLDTSVGDPQRHQDDERGDQEDKVEIFARLLHHTRREVGAVDDRSCLQCRHAAIDLLFVRRVDIESAHKQQALLGGIDPIRENRHFGKLLRVIFAGLIIAQHQLLKSGESA